mmetsp:Transcript_10130/g.29250  ORF Transcript_10130/g.29250 Transcript_10130/m.29250 type:complete len:129 (+) Transcript_10130:306-692(+)
MVCCVNQWMYHAPVCLSLSECRLSTLTHWLTQSLSHSLSKPSKGTSGQDSRLCVYACCVLCVVCCVCVYACWGWMYEDSVVCVHFDVFCSRLVTRSAPGAQNQEHCSFRAGVRIPQMRGTTGRGGRKR